MKYIPTIGLEMHCEVKSNSKVFSSAENKYNEIPNSNVRPLDLALPGTVPGPAGTARLRQSGNRTHRHRLPGKLPEAG